MSADEGMDEVAELLRRGGLELGRPEETRYEPASDPVGAERVAAWLAHAIAPLRPSALVIWDDPDHAVLAHLVGLQLNLQWIRCYEEDRLVRVSGPVRAGDRLVLIGDVIRSDTPLENIRLSIELYGASLVGVAVLLAPATGTLPAAPGVRLVSLIDR